MQELFKKRINYAGELEDISQQVCKDYKLGKLKANKLILQGYEDFNFIIETIKNKYFVKVFASFRTLEDCIRYTEIMKKAVEANVSTPKVYKSEQGYLSTTTINKAKLRLCVMEYIDGENIYESKQKLNSNEIKFVAHQAARINSINLKPHFIYDSWAITNFLKEYEGKGKYLKPRDAKVVEPLIKKFKDLKIDTLPHCFVHGDIIATNLMRDKNDGLKIIDFAVSNYYPRVQEIAVISCNLLLDKNKDVTDQNTELLLKEYQKKIKLTERELEVLPTYTKLAHAMHVLRANYEDVVNNDHSEENKYWLNQGRTGLRQMN